MIKHLTASVFVIADPPECLIALLRHRTFAKWMVPGGHVEPSENPFEAAVREVREETGLRPRFITFTPGDVRSRGDNAVPKPEMIVEELIPGGPKDPAHIHIDCLYMAIAERAQFRPVRQESTDIRWFSKGDLHRVEMFDQTRAIALAIMSDIRHQRPFWEIATVPTYEWSPIW